MKKQSKPRPRPTLGDLIMAASAYSRHDRSVVAKVADMIYAAKRP